MVASLLEVPDHIKSPDSVELKVSGVDDSRIGAFCVWPIAKGTEFGPYDGTTIFRNDVDPRYSWDVYDLESLQYLHTIDATDPGKGNWMRYVCCARFYEEQNIVSTQKEDQVYYRALKEILPGEELLTWFQPKRKHGSRRQSVRSDHNNPQNTQDEYQKSPGGSPSKQKRKRKPKIIPDSYEGPLDFDLRKSVKPRSRADEEFEPLQPGQKRRRRKKVEHDNKSSLSTLEPQTPDCESSDMSVFQASLASEPASPVAEEEKPDLTRLPAAKKKDCTTTTISEINDTVDWTYPTKGQEFVFEVQDYHVVTKHKKKVFRCDICLGLYKHMFSLKRHYLRNHINYKYLSKADMVNCLINLSQVKLGMETREQVGTKPECTNGVPVKIEDGSATNNTDVIGSHTVKAELDVNEDITVKTEIEADFDLNPSVTLDTRCEDKIGQNNNTIKDELFMDVQHSHEINGELGDKESENYQESSEHFVTSFKSCNSDSETVAKSVNDLYNTGASHSEGSERNLKNIGEDFRMENFGSLKIDEDLLKEEECSESSREVDADEDEVPTHKVADQIMNDEYLSKDDEGPTKEDATEEIIDEESDNLFCLETLNSSNEDLDDTSNITTEINEAVGISDVKNNVSKDVDRAGIGVDPGVDDEADMSGLYQCYTCYQVFDTLEDVREHVQNHPETSDSNCFPCDQCNMMFKYKQNLIRHKKVHEEEEVTSGSETVSANTTPVQGNSQPGRKKQKDTVTDFITHDNEDVDTVQTYRCDKCKNVFPSLSVLMKHVQTEHKSGSKFQCQYCGKDFLSLPNMKKHVRFHLGYRASCRYCSENFPNVGALRRHTRLAHPEHHKTKLLDKILNTSDTGSSQKAAGNTSNKEISSEKSKLNTSEVKSETKPYKEGYLYAHGVGFTADEIDDGGSRFKFSCTVCKKRFSNYVNMCRHRRKVHNDKPRELLSLDISRKGSNISPIVIEDPVEVAQFYANVSQNIAINLNVFIDGKTEALNKYTEYIKIEDYRGLASEVEEKAAVDENGSCEEKESESEDIETLCWEDYNFPQNYKPVKTVPVTEAASSCLSSTSEKRAVKENESIPEVQEETTDLRPSEEAEQHQTMGRSLASLGVSTDNGNLQKTSKSSIINGRMFQKFRIFDGKVTGVQSPASKNFDQVLNGEYANFENDLLPNDVDSPIIERSGSVSSSRSRSNTLKESRSPTETSNTSSDVDVDYNAVAKEELAALYAEMDSDEMSLVHIPQSLSQLCEKVLGLHCNSSRRNAMNSPTCEDSSLLAKLLLTANKKAGYITAPSKNNSSQPDFSDEQDDSPFYNYESIAFGRNGQIERVCAICKNSFQDIESLARHHWKKHPTSMFNFLEVEQGNSIEDLHYSHPSPTGALAATDPGLHRLEEMESFRCTLCESVFKSIHKLHVHIINCSSIDPVYGMFKSDRSPYKNSMKKKFQKKFHNLFQGDMRCLKSKHSSFGDSTKSQNRVFTGCRKRTSMLLPDSPTKSYLELLRQTQEASTGYNPHNHVRRRELTQLVDTLTCEGCGLKFKTIILLERHVKNCTKKEKFKNVKPMTCPIMDESLAKIKNVCFYCEKNFTYTKSLVNHFQDFCLVKKSKLDKGELTEEERHREKEILDKLNKQQEEEKTPKDAETDSTDKPRKHWQVGRRPKRKGNAWTSIKKRKVPLFRKSTELEPDAVFENNVDEEEEEEEGEEEEEEEEEDDQEYEDNDNNSGDGDNLDESDPKEKSEPEADDISIRMVEKSGKNIIRAKPSELSRNNMFVFPVKNGQIDQCPAAVIKNECEEIVPVDLIAGHVSNPLVRLKEEQKDEKIELDQPEGLKQNFDSEHDVSGKEQQVIVSDHAVIEQADANYEDDIRNLVTAKDKSKTDDLHNTSLECTARYKVNVVTLPKLEKGSKPEIVSSSAMFQCIAKQADEENRHVESEVTDAYSKKIDNTLMLEGKRKRARVSRVEEFIRNTFRRRRKRKDHQDKNEGDEDKSTNGALSEPVIEDSRAPESVRKRRGRTVKEEKIEPVTFVPRGRKAGRPCRYRSPDPPAGVKDGYESADSHSDKVQKVKKTGRHSKANAKEDKKTFIERESEQKVIGKVGRDEQLDEDASKCSDTPNTNTNISREQQLQLSDELAASVSSELQNGGGNSGFETEKMIEENSAELNYVDNSDPGSAPSKKDCDRIVPHTQLSDISDNVCSDEVDGDIASKKSLTLNETVPDADLNCHDDVLKATNENNSELTENQGNDTIKSEEVIKVHVDKSFKLDEYDVAPCENLKLEEDTAESDIQQQEVNHSTDKDADNVDIVISKTTVEPSDNEVLKSDVANSKQNELVCEAEADIDVQNSQEKDSISLESHPVNENLLTASSPEPLTQSYKVGTIMSPGERVKMNKRSCKKEVDISSPIWVRRTSKPKSKSDVRKEVTNTEETATVAKDPGQVKVNGGKYANDKVKGSEESFPLSQSQQSQSRSGTVRTENVIKDKQLMKGAKSSLSKLRKVFDKTQNNLSGGNVSQTGKRGTGGSLKRKLPVEESSASDAKISRRK